MTALASPQTSLAQSKVPEVTIAFWIIKILATTLGETGGDALSMELKLGYAVSTGIFFGFFLVTAAAQIKAKAYHPYLYWAVIVATTTVGTTTSDYLTRTAGLGYPGASAVLFSVLMVILILWRLWLGTISVEHINNPKAESCYWLAILVSNTLGTALGDAVADDETGLGLGFRWSALIFFGVIVLIAALYKFTKISHTILFWAAFILTRPLGATLGDVFTKEKDEGGLDIKRSTVSLVLLIVMFCLVLISSRRQRDKEPLEVAY